MIQLVGPQGVLSEAPEVRFDFEGRSEPPRKGGET